MYNVIVIGAVNSTAVILTKLKEHNFNVVGVLGHEPKNAENVSGWYDLKSLANKYDIDYYGFKRINDSEYIEWAKSKKPDIIFAVGFSQLMSSVWLQMPTLGCIGFHPTKLPEGRGRAPLAWITLEKNIGSATFFLMGEGADDGPIFSQSLFEVNNSDDAASVGLKIEQHIHMALDKWLPNLKNGIWEPIPQEEALATWYGVRKPEDGCIEWSGSASYIDRLIKATTFPHPGAYTYFKDEKVIILESTKETHIPIKGVVGRILLKDKEKGCLIQCGDGLLWINNLIFESDKIQLKVGNKLGYNIQDEIYLIKKHLKNE